MKRATTLSFFLAAALAVYAVAQDQVFLRKSHKVNAVESYKVAISGTQSVDVPQMGPMDMGYNGSYNWIFKTTAVDETKKEAEVDMTIKDFKFEMTGPMQMGEMPMPKDVTSKVKLDSRYRMGQTKSANLNMQSLLAMGAASTISPFIELPEALVKPGDTWTVTMPKSDLFGTAETQLQATFTGDGAIGEKKGLAIELTGKIPVNMDMSKVMEELAKSGNDPSGGMAAGMKMVVGGTMAVKISSVLDRATGVVLASTVTINSDMVLNLVDMGMTMPAKGATTISVVSQ